MPGARGTVYQVKARARLNDNTWASTPWHAISDQQPVLLEVLWAADRSSGGHAPASKMAPNGRLALFIDGVVASAFNNLDNDSFRIDRALMGIFGGVDAGTQDSFFIDHFESFNK